jgi:hypothetical protein
MRQVARAIGRGDLWSGGQTTQLVVGAAGETDREIATAAADGYRELKLARVYYSALRLRAGARGAAEGCQLASASQSGFSGTIGRPWACLVASSWRFSAVPRLPTAPSLPNECVSDEASQFPFSTSGPFARTADG